ncbi:MAG: DUF3499 family protein [Acidimicrobiales bacterium]
MAANSRCARPGCGGEPAAWLSYDYGAQRVWLDDPGTTPRGHYIVLCAAHAQRTAPPRGWSCIDRRTTRLSALRPPAPATAAAGGSRDVPPAIAV